MLDNFKIDVYKSTHFDKYFVKAQKIQSKTIIKIHVKKK